MRCVARYSPDLKTIRAGLAKIKAHQRKAEARHHHAKITILKAAFRNHAASPNSLMQSLVLLRLAPDCHVAEIRALHFVGAVNVAKVDHDRARHHAF